jgi:hypothetical protein
LLKVISLYSEWFSFRWKLNKIRNSWTIFLFHEVTNSNASIAYIFKIDLKIWLSHHIWYFSTLTICKLDVSALFNYIDTECIRSRIFISLDASNDIELVGISSSASINVKCKWYRIEYNATWLCHHWYYLIWELNISAWLFCCKLR